MGFSGLGCWSLKDSGRILGLKVMGGQRRPHISAWMITVPLIKRKNNR